ncbi:MAG: hypothetical protein IJ053_02530 [Lachnospiraceae bacterium]|nr:hypothetical protein [Lachnospiraceae bacterium]
MITPVIAAQGSAPIAQIQQHNDSQSILNSQNAHTVVEKHEQQVHETVVPKEEGVYYQQEYDAKEEGSNKYSNLYGKKKKKENKEEDKKEESVTRVNFDIQI